MTEHDPQMLKGALSLLLLHLCRSREDYGYSLVTRLQNLGFTDLAEGTVYPALSRLEGQGFLDARLVRSSSGPARKYYRPTESGLQELVRARDAWISLIALVRSALTQEEFE